MLGLKVNNDSKMGPWTKWPVVADLIYVSISKQKYFHSYSSLIDIYFEWSNQQQPSFA